MKRILSVILCMLLLAGALAGCGTQKSEADGKLRIVTTIFPEYDWVMNVLGDEAKDAEVTLLLDSGVDLHSFQPSASDMVRIADCDLFIYVGGESDAWAADALASAAAPDRRTLNLLEVLGNRAKLEETVEGMEEAEDEEEAGYDEHVWLSLKNASVFVSAIRDALCALDETHADAYTANAAAYTDKLNALDENYQAAVDGGRVKTLLFADRFPFRYLTEDYGLSYYAAFSGCSAESEASFETVAFLAERLWSLGLPAVLTLEGTGHKIAETVVGSAQMFSDAFPAPDIPILSMDSMQSATAKDVQDGLTYLAVMEKNLAVLTEALG